MPWYLHVWSLVGTAVALSVSADEQAEEASTGAALEQRKKLVLPSSIIRSECA
jgi:hypothetical protein